MSDAATNSAHAEHYVNQSRGQHGAIVRLQEENARLREALEQIANQDFRGNRSTEQQIAWRALNV